MNPEDVARYQTVVAKHPGAAAAPTAALHFDEALLARLQEMGVPRASVTLHVGAGTFSPVKTENLSEHRMHSEWYSIPAATLQAIADCKARGGRVLAVGTTTVRTLESWARSGCVEGDTAIFITPGFDFKVVDVVINLRPAQHQAGAILGGVLQGNNYGLSQFGRNQVLGNVRIAGLTPLSELTLTTQQSKGVGFYRAEYEAPLPGSGMRWKGYVSHVGSEANQSKGLSKEMGMGLTKLLNTDRTGRWLAGSEVSRRDTQNLVSGVQSAHRVDEQLRLKIRAESSKGWVDNFTNEFVLTAGNINLARDAADQANDAAIGTGAHVTGSYKKIEMNGGLVHALDKVGVFTGTLRWKVQAASKNLDGYNKISLGGVNGVRAYTSIDGVGDQGAQLSIDVVHQVVPDVYGGLFYDAGTVKSSRNPLIGSADASYYNLQAAGMQVGGKISDFNWVMTFAYAMGRPPASVWNTNNTQPGDSRINFSVTRPF
jgi:hemolysin activation/secretion protein